MDVMDVMAVMFATTMATISMWVGGGAVAATADVKSTKSAGNNCSHKCVRSMRVKRMKRVIKPYKGWLWSTRQCESGGNYGTNTGNGFYGAYQFVLSTWYSVGGHGLPNRAAPLEQDYRAVKLRRIAGTGQWPVCG